MHMTTTRAAKTWAYVLLLASMAASAGCSRKVWITHYPSFYDEQITTVAVVPFRNHTGSGGAGRFVADAVAKTLADNGAYRVLGPEVVAEQLASAKLTVGPGDDAAAITAKLKQLGGVDAFVHGDVTTFAVEADSGYAFTHVHHHGHFSYGHHGRHGFGVGYVWYPIPRTEANVAARAKMVRVADGVTLFAMSKPGLVTVHAPGYGAGKWLDGLLGHAADRLAMRFVRRTAPGPLRIRIKPGEALRITRRRQSGAFKDTDNFKAGNDSLYVELRLPAVADRNLFRVSITPEDDDRVLASQTVLWNGAESLHRLSFPLAALVAEAGHGDYLVSVHTGDAKIMAEDFEIEGD